MPPELRLFGGVSILVDGRPLSGAAAQPRRLAVLALLADAFPAPVTRERVVGVIWPDQDETGARRLLTQALYEVRRELGAELISASGRDLALDPDALSVDLVEFRRAVQAGDADRAVALHRGPFLDGFYLRDGGEFERWAAGVRDSAQRELRRVIESTISRFESAGDARQAARWIERLLDVAPHDAGIAVRAIDLHDRAGDPGAAARVASAYERRMREDLELPPDESVVRRAAKIGQSVRVDLGDAPATATIGASAGSVSRDVDVEQLVAREPVSAAARPNRRRRRISLPAGIVGCAAMIALAAGVRGTIASATTMPAVAVTRFDSPGGAEGAYIAASLTPLLVSNLDGAGGTAVDTTPTSHARLLRGSVVVSGRAVRIDAALAPREGDGPELRASVSGPMDSLAVLAERLAMDLLPELYANVDASSRREVVHTLRGVRAARAYLDGESALNRAAFDSAYTALRAATQADSGNAFLWYRRAVAAEEIHDIDDADRSAAFADDRRAALSERESRLVHAYRVWRMGDVRSADSLYREILRTRPLDAEAWFHFAEVSYHGGPLVGRPLDAARDAWRRAVALDSNSFPALMHAIRLEARVGDVAMLGALLRRAERVQAREPYLSEARAIAAAAGGRAAFSAADLARLDAMPDASLQFVHAIVASFVERPDLSREAATRLVASGRPDAVRSEGYAALAHLAMARGQTRLADALLDSLGQRSAVKSVWARSYFATLPFLPRDSAMVAKAKRQLARLPSRATDAPLYLELSVDAAAATLIDRYEAALLSSRPEDGAALLDCAGLTNGSARELCVDLRHGVVAEGLERRGEHAAALEELEAMSMRVPYQLAGRSMYFARTRERFLRAQLLERAGRLDEAYDWYAATPHASRLDYLYLTPSHLGRARVRERQGNIDGAATHYRQALELLASADGGMRELRREASAGVQRMARESRSTPAAR